MRAFVSGQSGIALLNEGSHWSVLRGSGGAPLEGQLSSAIRLLDGSTDIEEIPDADAQDVGVELAAASAKDTALQYVLVLAQEAEIGELERRILARLKHLLFLPEIPEFILDRLYAAPLSSSERAQVKALIADDRQHPVSAIFRSVLRDQASISRVRSAWESISAGRFRSVQDKDEFFFSALDRKLVRRLAQNPQRLLWDATADDVDILLAWAEAAGLSSARLIAAARKAGIGLGPAEKPGEPAAFESIEGEGKGEWYSSEAEWKAAIRTSEQLKQELAQLGSQWPKGPTVFAARRQYAEMNRIREEMAERKLF